MSHRAEHRAPAECPVCGEHLAVTRLGCGGCGTELVGLFAPCQFCALDAGEVAMLRVFLASRGNLRELERHLAVSYPTARQRFTDLLQRLGLVETEPSRLESETVRSEVAPPSRDKLLTQVAAGEVSPAAAARLLAQVSD